MKKRLFAVGVFLLILVLATEGWFLVNRMTPVLFSGMELPVDMEIRQYALEGAVWDVERQGYRLTLRGEATEDLTLTVADLDEATVLSWGEPVATWGADDLYQRVRTILLPSALIREKGGIDLLIQSEAWGSDTKDLLSQRNMTQAKLLLSSIKEAERSFALAFGLSMLSAGIHILIIVSSIALYRRKNSEKYLLFLSCVAAMSLFATIMTANLPVLPLRLKTYHILQPMIATCSAVLTAAAGLSIFEKQVPPQMKKFLTLRTFFSVMLGLVILRFLSSFSIYTVLRWILLIPVVWVISEGYIQKEPGAWPMLVGYGLNESIAIFVFLVNNFQAAVPGSFISYIRVNQLGNLFVLIPALILINQRFADKFQESERLSIELARMNDELDRKVEERTLQLQEEQAKKNNMMTNIFHDIRSPIFVLQGNLAQLHLSKEEEPLKVAMEDKLDFLKRLTEDLFLISKLEEGAILYEENPIELTDVLRQMENGVQVQAELAQVDLTFCVEGPLPVWADWQRIRQALQNLIDNAFHYTPAGGTVQVTAFRQDSEALVQIQDTGSGISPEDLPLLFERYFKGSRADNPRSSGLGLYIANEIIRHHHGSIMVKSQIGVGSCFTVHFPLLQKE